MHMLIQRAGVWCEPVKQCGERITPEPVTERRTASRISRSGCVMAGGLFEPVRGRILRQYGWYRGFSARPIFHGASFFIFILYYVLY